VASTAPGPAAGTFSFSQGRLTWIVRDARSKFQGAERTSTPAYLGRHATILFLPERVALARLEDPVRAAAPVLKKGVSLAARPRNPMMGASSPPPPPGSENAQATRGAVSRKTRRARPFNPDHDMTCSAAKGGFSNVIRSGRRHPRGTGG